jgi:hypothetical protein
MFGRGLGAHVPAAGAQGQAAADSHFRRAPRPCPPHPADAAVLGRLQSGCRAIAARRKLATKPNPNLHRPHPKPLGAGGRPTPERHRRAPVRGARPRPRAAWRGLLRDGHAVSSCWARPLGAAAVWVSDPPCGTPPAGRPLIQARALRTQVFGTCAMHPTIWGISAPKSKAHPPHHDKGACRRRAWRVGSW